MIISIRKNKFATVFESEKPSKMVQIGFLAPPKTFGAENINFVKWSTKINCFLPSFELRKHMIAIQRCEKIFYSKVGFGSMLATVC